MPNLNVKISEEAIDYLPLNVQLDPEGEMQKVKVVGFCEPKLGVFSFFVRFESGGLPFIVNYVDHEGGYGAPSWFQGSLENEEPCMVETL